MTAYPWMKEIEEQKSKLEEQESEASGQMKRRLLVPFANHLGLSTILPRIRGFGHIRCQESGRTAAIATELGKIIYAG